MMIRDRKDIGISKRFLGLHDLTSFPNPRPGKPLGHLYLERHCKKRTGALIPAALLPERTFCDYLLHLRS